MVRSSRHSAAVPMQSLLVVLLAILIECANKAHSFASKPSSSSLSSSLSSTALSSSSSSSSSSSYIVRVCQNKDCRGRYPPTAAAGETLLRTFRDLLAENDDNVSAASSCSSSIAIVPSECLGQCGRGPNVCVEEKDEDEEEVEEGGLVVATETVHVNARAKTGRGGGGREGGQRGDIKSKLYFGVFDSQTAAAILEIACDYDVPTKLLVAADVIARAGRATNPYKKISLLTTIIDSLSEKEGGDPPSNDVSSSSSSSSSSSTALARAFVLRADARLEASSTSYASSDPTPASINGCFVDDARRAVELDPTYGKAWRVMADARLAIGDMEGAIEALNRLAETEPSLERKVKEEAERLLRIRG